MLNNIFSKKKLHFICQNIETLQIIPKFKNVKF